MKINPIIILNILITFFLIIAVGTVVLMVKNEMNLYYISASVIISAFLLFILYTINKGILTSNKAAEEINQYKAKLLYHQDYFTIVAYSQDQLIYWRDIEAIFLINSPPLDGEYHTMEYRIFLNKQPQVRRKQPIKWYDKILPEPQQEKFPMIKIDDDYHIDFNTFYPSLEKFLFSEKKSSDFINGKSSNEKKHTQNETISTPYSKKFKTTGFYKIFDKGTFADYGSLKDYREQATEI